MDQPLVTGEIASGYAKQIRQGLRQALREGVALGGLRPATKRRNDAAHAKALQQVMEYRDVLEAGHDKSLSALSRDLFDAGCCTRSGKPLTPEMVRRLRIRLEEAGEAVAVGDPAPRARAALDEPEEEGPSDQELERFLAERHRARMESESAFGCPDFDGAKARAARIADARAVLDR
jgi:hypothetical protein